MDIAQTIVHLLEKHHKVHLNKIGTFSTQYVAAKIDAATMALTPPFYEVHFMKGEAGDEELLLNHLQEKLGFKQEEVQEIIENWQQKLLHKLKTEHAAYLKGLGTFLLKHGEITFSADKLTQDATGAYGLEKLDLNAFEVETARPKLAITTQVEEPLNIQHEAVVAQMETAKAKNTKPKVWPVMLIWVILIGFLTYLYLLLQSSFLPLRLQTFSGEKSMFFVSKPIEKQPVEAENIKEAVIEPDVAMVDSLISDSLLVLNAELDGTKTSEEPKPIEFKIVVQEFKTYGAAVSLKRDMSSLGIPAEILSNSDSSWFTVTAYNSYADSLSALPNLKSIKSRVHQGATLRTDW